MQPSDLTRTALAEHLAFIDVAAQFGQGASSPALNYVDAVRNMAYHGGRGGGCPPLPLCVQLSSRGNPDHGQDPDEVLFGTPADLWVNVVDIEQAQAVCRGFIEHYGLGGGNWAGGALHDGTRLLGRISYNGRFNPMTTTRAVQVGPR